MQMTRLTRPKWVMPLFSVALGLPFFTAQWIGDPREDSSLSESWPPSAR